jgi:hypothetical protein
VWLCIVGIVGRLRCVALDVRACRVPLHVVVWILRRWASGSQLSPKPPSHPTSRL